MHVGLGEIFTHAACERPNNLTHPLTGRCFTAMPRNVSWNHVLKEKQLTNYTVD